MSRTEETAAGAADGRHGADAATFVYRIDLQYDGSAFSGWALQEERPTVQGALTQAFAAVLGEVPPMRVAGRTDAGVHARHQVLSIRVSRPVDPERLARALEALTPPEIGLLGCWEAPPSFDPRRDALSRTYRYYLQTASLPDPFTRRYSWHVPHALDCERLRWAASRTVGQHDFRAFTPTETEHVFFHRTVFACSWHCEGSLVWLEIEANAFLRHMVRILVGTMVDLGRGRLSPGGFEALLRGSPRSAAGPTAPPHGLFLWSVKYGDRWAGSLGASALTPPVGSTIMPTCVSRRYGENLFGKTR